MILALGANGPVGLGAVRQALANVEPRRVPAVVTPRNQATTRAAMREAARRSPDRVLLMDWAFYSRSGGGWFAADGPHVTETGARAYAAFVRRRGRGVVAPPVAHAALPRPSRDEQGVRARQARTLLEVAVVRGAADLPAMATHRTTTTSRARRTGDNLRRRERHDAEGIRAATVWGHAQA